MRTFLISMVFAVGCVWVAFAAVFIVRGFQSWRDQQGENNG